MPIVFPGSFAEKRLKDVAKRLGGRVAKDFNGIVVNGNAILYRHGQFGTIFTRGKKYQRMNWGWPFGKEGQLTGVDYVLLHHTKPDEKFFLFPVKEARVLASVFQHKLNIAVDPINGFSPAFYKDQEVRKGRQLTRLKRRIGREDVMNRQVSLADLKRVLK